MNESITIDSWVEASPGQVSTELAGETVILGESEGKYFGLNAVGSRVWEMLAAPVAVRRIVDTIVDEYDVSPERCAADVLSLLSELSRRGLARTTESP